MTMANEKWTSEVKRHKSNEKLMTKWEAKSKWNINVNISIERQTLNRSVALINEGSAVPPVRYAERLMKHRAWGSGARGHEISLSNCRPLFPCLSACQSLSCQTQPYRNNLVTIVMCRPPGSGRDETGQRSLVSSNTSHYYCVFHLQKYTCTVYSSSVWGYKHTHTHTHYPVTTTFIPIWFILHPWESSIVNFLAWK